jgi:hypothetical protein
VAKKKAIKELMYQRRNESEVQQREARYHRYREAYIDRILEVFNSLLKSGHDPGDVNLLTFSVATVDLVIDHAYGVENIQDLGDMIDHEG